MASRKQLKKSINYICSELFTDCMALRMCEQEHEKSDRLMAQVLQLHAEYVASISHVLKGQEKQSFKKLREEFIQKVNALSEEIVKP